MLQIFLVKCVLVDKGRANALNLTCLPFTILIDSLVVALMTSVVYFLNRETLPYHVIKRKFLSPEVKATLTVPPHI